MSLQAPNLRADIDWTDYLNRVVLRGMNDALEIAQRPNADIQGCYGRALRDAINAACIEWWLGRGDDAVEARLQEARGYAERLLRAPGAATSRLRSYDVNVTVEPTGGATVTALHEKVDRGRGLLSIISYMPAFLTIVSYGDRSGMELLARYPEEGYRSPNVVAGEEIFTRLRAYKAWLLGDAALARREAQAALKATTMTKIRAEIEALLALVAGDAEAFGRHLADCVAGHKKVFGKKTAEPETLICQPGMMLARLAIDRGIALEECPYLPLRFLPNFPASRVH